MGICLKPVLNHLNDFHPIMLKLNSEKQPYNGFRYAMMHNRNLNAINIQQPNELYPLLKIDTENKMIKKHNYDQDPPHWEFCNSILTKVSNTISLVVNQLENKELRDAVCILYLVIRALDNVEDDSSITDEMKVPVLKAFHRHIYDRDFHFPCGTKDKKRLMDNFHHVSTAFLELNKSYQEVIENTAMKMGTGMAEFISKEIETISDYNEYCYNAGSLFTIAFIKLFHVSGEESLIPDALSTRIGLFFQKADIIKDYLVDINETPNSLVFWPREIWSKYANNLKDLTYEENSKNAIRCVNEMVTDALEYIGDCLDFLSRHCSPSTFRFFAVLQVITIRDLAICYNNIQVFRTGISMRNGLKAEVFVHTKTMANVYEAFYDFSSILRSKVDMNDPNAKTTISRIEAVQKLCKDSGTLIKWKSYIIESQTSYNQIVLLITTVGVLYAWRSHSGLNKIGSTSSQTNVSTHISSTRNVANK